MTDPDHTCTARALPFSPTGAPVDAPKPKPAPAAVSEAPKPAAPAEPAAPRGKK